MMMMSGAGGDPKTLYVGNLDHQVGGEQIWLEELVCRFFLYTPKYLTNWLMCLR